MAGSGPCLGPLLLPSTQGLSHPPPSSPIHTYQPQIEKKPPLSAYENSYFVEEPSDLLPLPPFHPSSRPQFEPRSKTKALFLYFDFLFKISNMQETPTQPQISGKEPRGRAGRGSPSLSTPGAPAGQGGGGADFLFQKRMGVSELNYRLLNRSGGLP